MNKLNGFGSGVFLLLLLSTGNMQAQETVKTQPEKKKLLKNYREVENISVIKFDPTRMFKGEISVGYERVMGANSSLLVEAGPTISKIYDFGLDHFYYPYTSEKSDLGLFGSAEYRFYPVTTSLNGLYVAPKLKYKVMNSQFQDNVGELGSKRGGTTEYAYIFNIGVQKWLAEQFSFDFYAGMGIGYVYEKQFSVYSYYNESTMDYESAWQQSNYQGAKFFINAGVKVGIGYKAK